jgi:hypothetical protein
MPAGRVDRPHELDDVRLPVGEIELEAEGPAGVESALAAEGEHRPAAGAELAAGRRHVRVGDRDADPRRGAGRTAADGLDPEVARKCAGPRVARHERLLDVPDAVGVRVPDSENRQVAVGELRRRQPRQARAVPLRAGAADVDGRPPPVRAPRDHLAAVGDVERERLGRAGVGERVAARLPERQVVDAGVGQPRASDAGRPSHEEQRRQKALELPVRRPLRPGEQALTPQIPLRAQGRVDRGRVPGRENERLARNRRLPSGGSAAARSRGRDEAKRADDGGQGARLAEASTTAHRPHRHLHGGRAGRPASAKFRIREAAGLLA